LLEYNKREQSFNPVVEYEKITIFGVHTCDLAGIQCLNMVFTAKPVDANYVARKDKIAIIGLECNKYCDEHATCGVMDNHLPNGGYDLFFTEFSDRFLVHVNTMLGEKMVEDTAVFTDADASDMKELEELRSKKRSIFKNEVTTSHKGLFPLFEKAYDSKVWEELGKKCVSCGNCTNVCPTCYCFDVRFETNLDLNTGVQTRNWDSCQNEDFAKIAGGESFREPRGARQRHRYMRKFNYPVKRYSRYFCTGCGRCTRACMAQINLKDTINALAEENK